jgi:actin-like ATPase involved in cell morphogenesis
MKAKAILWGTTGRDLSEEEVSRIVEGRYGIVIGEMTAEEVKSLLKDGAEGIKVEGRDRETGERRSVRVWAVEFGAGKTDAGRI